MLVELFASNCAGVQTKYEDKNFRDSLALDFGIWWRQVKTIYKYNCYYSVPFPPKY